MARPRVLTFNFHEPYLCLMARIGLPITVGIYSKPDFARQWQTRFRPIPRNLTFAEETEWRPGMESGAYDVVVAHNELNALDVFNARAACILVCHNRRTFLETTVAGDPSDGRQKYTRLLEHLADKFSFIFISHSKKADYGLPGAVIPPGIDVREYGGYTGETAEVLRVGNAMRARNLMFDVDFQEEVCIDFPHRIVGEDPGIPNAQPSHSFQQLLETYRDLRCLLHVTREEYEDGYNLSMLEALATGMPVVSLANKTSPIVDGVNGFVSYDPRVLRERIATLLNDVGLAKEIGRRGREMVEKTFPMAMFEDRWRETLERAAESGNRGVSERTMSTTPITNRANVGDIASSGVPRIDILMEYFSSPFTTARYMETALRSDQNLVTIGDVIPAALLREWGFEGPPPHLHHPEIKRGRGETFKSTLSKLSDGFRPSLYFWVDSGVEELPSDLDSLELPRICYLIDTHCALADRIAIAKHFNFTFVAQRTRIPEIIHAGIPNVAWLPLACAPELHEVGEFERTIDVAFAGAVPDDPTHRRRKLIDTVLARFPNSSIGRCWPEEMATRYAQSKIVINVAAAHDVNMRVFEALASGALLITDEADGLEELFEDKKHLVVYRSDEELVPLIEKYLADNAARLRIAAAGRALVLAEHTYRHRMQRMVYMVLEAIGALGGQIGEARFQRGGYYRSPRPELAAHVPRHAARVLDVGCGGGEFGLGLKQRGAKEVVGIEVIERAYEIAKQVLDRAYHGSIESMDLPFEDDYFDCIVFGDVLEHLINPADALKKVSRILNKDGVIVMSIPNVRYWHTVEMHINGRWKYEEAGIMDRTHLRFFCATDMVEMVRDAGLKLIKIQPLSMWPPDQLRRDENGCLRLGRLTFGPLDDAEYQDFLVYQYLVIAAKPEMDALAEARRALEERDNETALRLAKEAQDADEFERTSLMARAAARSGRLDLADALFRKALALRPDDGSLAGESALVLLASNRIDAAAPLLERAATADPENDRVIAGQGLVAIARGDLDAAIDRFKAALEIRFDNKPIVMRLIDCACALNRPADAEPFVRRYVDFYPGDTEMAYTYAALLHDLGRNDEAKDRLDTLLLFVPNHEAAAKLLGSIAGNAP